MSTKGKVLPPNYKMKMENEFCYGLGDFKKRLWYCWQILRGRNLGVAMVTLTEHKPGRFLSQLVVVMTKEKPRPVVGVDDQGREVREQDNIIPLSKDPAVAEHLKKVADKLNGKVE